MHWGPAAAAAPHSTNKRPVFRRRLETHHHLTKLSSASQTSAEWDQSIPARSQKISVAKTSAVTDKYKWLRFDSKGSNERKALETGNIIYAQNVTCSMFQSFGKLLYHEGKKVIEDYSCSDIVVSKLLEHKGLQKLLRTFLLIQVSSIPATWEFNIL